MTRHILGVLGVIAAGVLLAVSAMMNYRFGYSLGKTPSDGHIYGLASAAADCFKALVPFFFFAALRNRMWSQVAAAALVWVVVTGYAMTSALGHAALNRLDTSGKRAAASANYKDLRADLKHTRDKLSWLPPHRGAAAVKADIEGLKSQYVWNRSGECSEPAGRVQRTFCQGFHKLEAELANALEGAKLSANIEAIEAKLAKTTGATVMAEADPQASVLARLLGGVELEKVQTGLTVFVALLIEVGSGFGMYVAFAFWRMHAPAAPSALVVPAPQQVAIRQDAIWSEEAPATELAASEVNANALPAPEPPGARPFGDNDNEVSARIMPPNDVQRFYQDYIDGEAPLPSHVDATKLNEAYKLWCKRNGRRPLVMPNFLSEFDELKVKVEKHPINGVKYFGIALKPEVERELEKRASRKRKASQAPEQTEEAAADHSKAAA